MFSVDGQYIMYCYVGEQSAWAVAQLEINSNSGHEIS